MKRTIIIGTAGVFAAILLLTAITGMGRGEDEGVSSEEPGYASVRGLRNLMESGEPYLLIDVRTAGEYSSGHIPTAINIPYDVITEKIPEGSADRPVILYCRSGSRAGTALRSLEGAGYQDIINFGGIGKWDGGLVK